MSSFKLVVFKCILTLGDNIGIVKSKRRENILSSVWACAIALFFTLVITFMIAGCAGENFFDQLTVSSAESLSGYIVVSSSSAVAGTVGSSGAVALFDPQGVFVRSLRDYYDTVEVPQGLAVIGPTSVLINVDGSDRLELVNPLTSVYSTYSVSGISATPARQMAVDSNNNVYVAEYNLNTIEKIDSTGTRVGSPFISSGGGCTMSNVWGLTYVSSTDRLVVSNYSNSNLLFYNPNTGACASSVTNAAFGSNTTAIAYHAQTNKILTARITGEQIYASSAAGASPAVVYLNNSRVNDPYAIAVDSNGFVYIGANGQDTIEKFSFSGTTLTPVLSGPLIGPNVYTQNVTQIAIFD